MTKLSTVLCKIVREINLMDFQIAMRIETHPSDLSRYKNGQRPPPSASIYKLIYKLGRLRGLEPEEINYVLLLATWEALVRSLGEEEGPEAVKWLSSSLRLRPPS